MDGQGMRLNKFLSDAGVCSRREADRQAQAGNVLVNGEPANPGQKVFSKDRVFFLRKGSFAGGKKGNTFSK